MKKFVAVPLLALLLLVCSFLPAQTVLSVPLDDPAYTIIEYGVQRSILPIQPAAKPYSKRTVLGLLHQMQASDLLSPEEQRTLAATITRIGDPEDRLERGNLSDHGDMGTFLFGLDEESQFRINFGNPENFQTTNTLLFRLAGDISDFLSYDFAGGVSLDRLAPDFTYGWSIDDGSVNIGQAGTYAPYSFTKTWDGYHFWVDGTNDDGVGKVSMGFTVQSEIAAQFFDDDLTLRFDRMRHEWGQGDGSLFLSGTAPAFDGVEIHLRPASWFNYSWIVGSLGDWFVDSLIWENNPDIDVGSSTESEQKNFSEQMVEFFFTDWLYLNLAGSVVFGKRFELGYLNPLMVNFLTQNTQGDYDNTAIGTELAIRIPYLGKLRAGVFIDELRPTTLADPRVMLAWQVGLDSGIPILPFLSLTVQYTKIEPFTYTHYVETNYPGYISDINLAFTTNNENIGYYLPPNSDELLVRLTWLADPLLTLDLGYRLIRHGSNDETLGSGYIYGDIDIPIDYAWYDTNGYPDKNFLYDGVYDWSHVLSLRADLQLPDLPFAFYLQYIFSHTHWEANTTGVSIPEAVIQNILVVGVKIFK